MTPRGYNQTRAGLVGGGLPDPRAPPKTEDLGLAGVDDVFVPVCTIGQLYSYCMNLDIINYGNFIPLLEDTISILLT